MADYRQFYGLAAAPFSKGIPRGQLLVYPQLEELAQEMEELLTEGGIGLLSGEMGIGKTTALRHYLGGVDQQGYQVAYQGQSRHTTAVLAALVEQLGAAPTHLRSSLLRQLGKMVGRTWAEQRKKTLLVLDDAHLLEDSLLEDLRLLTNFEMDSADPVVLLLVGHPSLRLRLGRPVHLALLDRVRLHYRLEGLSREETAAYLDQHLVAAGGRLELFTPDAQEAVFQYAQGIPRRINTLALACLKKGASRKQKPIDGAFVSTVVGLLQKD